MDKSGRKPGRRLARMVVAGLWLVLCGSGNAAAILLEKPIDCQPGRDCFVQNYVDLEPGPGYADETCGPLAYDKHKGTDFRVSFEQMQAGVAVKAAAPGLVRGVRDGMPDISFKAGGKEAIQNRECGNGVVLLHPDGMETQYCHMRQGSVRVKPGEQVATGQVLGLVGLSGQTEFPHLHFEVRTGSRTLCPFTGRAMESGCGGAPKPLWSMAAQDALPYIPGGVLDGGFADALPDIDTLFVGGKKTDPLTPEAPALLFWAGFWGVRAGDTVAMRVTAPSGEVWTTPDQTIDRNKAQIVLSLGKKRTAPWAPGTYKGEAVLTRQGPDGKKIVIPVARTVTMP